MVRRQPAKFAVSAFALLIAFWGASAWAGYTTDGTNVTMPSGSNYVLVQNGNQAWWVMNSGGSLNFNSKWPYNPGAALNGVNQGSGTQAPITSSQYTPVGFPGVTAAAVMPTVASGAAATGSLDDQIQSAVQSGRIPLSVAQQAQTTDQKQALLAGLPPAPGGGLGTVTGTAPSTSYVDQNFQTALSQGQLGEVLNGQDPKTMSLAQKQQALSDAGISYSTAPTAVGPVGLAPALGTSVAVPNVVPNAVNPGAIAGTDIISSQPQTFHGQPGTAFADGNGNTYWTPTRFDSDNPPASINNAQPLAVGTGIPGMTTPMSWDQYNKLVSTTPGMTAGANAGAAADTPSGGSGFGNFMNLFGGGNGNPGKGAASQSPQVYLGGNLLSTGSASGGAGGANAYAPQVTDLTSNGTYTYHTDGTTSYLTMNGATNPDGTPIRFDQSGGGWMNPTYGIAGNATGGALPANLTTANFNATGGGVAGSVPTVTGPATITVPAANWGPSNSAYQTASGSYIDQYNKNNDASITDPSQLQGQSLQDYQTAMANAQQSATQTFSGVRESVPGTTAILGVSNGAVYQQNPENAQDWAPTSLKVSDLNNTAAVNAGTYKPTAWSSDSVFAGKSDEITSNEGKTWKDKPGTDKDCPVTSVVNPNGWTTCSGTKTLVQLGQITNQAAQQADSIAVQVKGQSTNNLAMQQGTQAASLEATAQQAKFAGEMDAGIGAVNLTFAGLETWKALAHGKQAKEYKTVQGMTESAADKDPSKGPHSDEEHKAQANSDHAAYIGGATAGTHGSGQYGGDGFIRGADSQSSVLKNMITNYSFNRKYTISEDEQADDAKCAKLVPEQVQACKDKAHDMRVSQFNGKVSAMGDDISDKSSGGQTEQNAMKAQATAGALMAGLTSATQLMGSYMQLQTAKQYEQAAAALNATTGAVIPAFNPVPTEQQNPARSPFTVPQAASTLGATASNVGPDGIPLQNPGFDTGGGAAGGPPVDPNAGEFQVGAVPQPKGAQGINGALTSGSTTPAPNTGDPQAKLALDDSGRAYLGGGEGPRQGYRGGGAGSDNSALDIAALLSKFLPNGDDAKKQDDPAELAFRNLASEGSGSLLGKDVNIFTRVHDRYNTKSKAGMVGI